MAKEEDEIQQGTSPEPQDTSRPSINVGDGADEEDAAEGAAPAAADKPSRKRQFAAVKQQAKDWETKYTQLQQEVAELRGRVSAPQPVIVREPGRQEQQADPAEAEIDNLQAQQDAILQALTTPNLAADQSEKFRKQWYKLDRQRQRAIVRAESGQLTRQAPGTSAEQMEQAAGNATLQADYPKIFDSDYYRTLAIAETNRIAAERRQRVSLTHAREAAAIVYARHGLGAAKAPAPSAEQRAKYEATGTRPSAVGGKDTWQPNKQQYRLAMSYTEHRKGLSDEQRLRAWYNEVGRPNNLV